MATFLDILPLLLLLAFLTGFGWIGYQMYLYSLTLSSHASSHMEKHHISLSKGGGAKIGVKHVSAEDEASKTQNVLVDTWNKSSMPDYKSRLWNKEAQEGIKKREKEAKERERAGK